MSTIPTWVTDRPNGWRAVPFRHLYRRTKRVGYENETLLSVYRDHGVVDKSSRSDNFNNASEDLGLYQLVDVGDLAINKMKAWQGSVAVSPIRGIVSPAYFVYAPTHQEHSGYLHYLLRSAEYTRLYQLFSKGIRVNQWDLDPSVHGSMPVLLPPVDEQRRIAEFLDRETAQIDDLIAKQEQLIATLAERLAARVFTAVTSGLDRLATLVPSGADWFASRPDTWSVQKLGRLGSVTLGKMLQASASEVGELRPYVRAGNIQEYGLDLTEVKYMPFSPLEAAKLDLRAGDLLVVEGGAGYGRSDVLREDLPLWSFQNHVIRFRSGSRASARYLDYVIKAVRATGHFEAMSSFATIPNVSADKLSGIKVPVPPVDVQSHIANELDESKGAVDELINAARRSMDLLRERRQALISAAVTGQIDVGGAS